jgi:hypothetical protein
MTSLHWYDIANEIIDSSIRVTVDTIMAVFVIHREGRSDGLGIKDKNRHC